MGRLVLGTTQQYRIAVCLIRAGQAGLTRCLNYGFVRRAVSGIVIDASSSGIQCRA